MGLLCMRHVTTLGTAEVHPTVWLMTDALLTAWWIVGSYQRGEGRVIAHPLGALAAAAAGGALWLARSFILSL